MSFSEFLGNVKALAGVRGMLAGDRVPGALLFAGPEGVGKKALALMQAKAVHWQAVDLLLKMLEEPPETTTFILVCPNAHELRPTIRSRCNRVQFLPVEDLVIEGMLQEQARLPRAQLPLGVRIASGSIAKAMTLDLAEFERRRRPWLDYLDGLAGPAEVPS